MAGEAAENQAQLAKLLGVAPKQVSKYLKDPRWSFGKAPWDAEAVGKIREWRKLKLSPNPADPGLPQSLPPALPQTPSPQVAAQPAEELSDAAAGIPSTPEAVNTWLKKERGMYLKLQREIEEGKYLPRADVEQGRLARIHAVKAGLAALPRQAEKFVGMTAEQIATVLEGEVEKVLHAFARDDAPA